MTPSIEIVVPISDVSEPLLLTVESLLKQTCRGFLVTLSSDGPSPAPTWVGNAESRLKSLGIEARAIRSGSKLGRIEHWNWAFLESLAIWVKPMLAGDLLDSSAVEEILRAAAAFPEAALVRFDHDVAETEDVARPADPQFRSAGEMSNIVARSRYVPVPLSALAFKRDALLALGGMRPMQPITGDRQLHTDFAIRYGELHIPKVLSRSSGNSSLSTDSLSAWKRASSGEKMTHQAMLAYHAWTTGEAVPLNALLRIMAACIK